MRVGLFDYGSGNLHSAAQALREAGAAVTVTANHAQLTAQDALVVPGVGAFGACMRGLTAAGGRELVAEWVASERPLLGICVGHQILFGSGTEHGTEEPGLGVLEGDVVHLPVRRLPHMGWNRVVPPAGSRLFRGLAGERFYFVHSYAVLKPPPGGLSSMTKHEGVSFVAAHEKGSISSTQFHPEKSGTAGVALLRNWLSGS